MRRAGRALLAIFAAQALDACDPTAARPVVGAPYPADASGLFVVDAALAIEDPSPEGAGVCAGGRPTGPFRDVTRLSGIHFRHHTVGDGRTCNMEDAFGPGSCLFDADGDGDLDAYLVDRAPHPNALFLNNGRGRFAEAPDAAGAADRSDSFGCLAYDPDGDGDLDLYVANLGPDRLYRNQRGRFTDVTAAAGLVEDGFTSSVTAGDIDGDGDEDLFVGQFVEGCDACRPEGCRSRRSLLFVNDRGRLVEEGAARGILGGDAVLVARFFDADEDGDLDLYAGSDDFIGAPFPDRLYINDGRGRFTDEGPRWGVAGSARWGNGATMGVDLTDLARDGGWDLITSNGPGTPALVFHCGARPPCAIDPRAIGLDVTSPWVKWGVVAEDFDHDGDPDLYLGNGDFGPQGQPDQYLVNEGGRFTEYEPAPCDALNVARSSRNVAPGDLDGDGDLDLLVSHVGAPPRVLRNVAAAGHWLIVAPQPPRAGTRVTVTAGGRSLTRHLTWSGTYLGSVPPTLHFGLGAATEAEVTAQWPGGRRVAMTHVRADRVVRPR